MTEQMLGIDNDTIMETKELVNMAKGIILDPITTSEQNNLVIEETKKVKRYITQLEEKRVSITKPLLESKRRIDEFFNTPILELKEIERNLKSATLEYIEKEEKKRREEERHMEEEAKREEEKKKKALEARAVKAEEKGMTEKAEELRSQAEEVYVPIQFIEKKEIHKDSSVRRAWKARVKDETVLPEIYFIKTINQKLLDAYAKTTNGTMKIPGVEFYCETSIVIKK